MPHRLILHAGMHKTGSTAIQTALGRTRRGADWVFLSPDGPNSSTLLRRAFAKGHAADRDLLAALIAGAGPAERAYLSAEYIRHLPPGGFEALCALARDHADRVEAVAYIRAPIAFVTSNYQQRLRTRFIPLDDLIRPETLDYAALFGRMEAELGAGALHLRPYRPETFPGGSVVADFADWHGLGPLSEKANAVVNPSLSGQGVRLLYLWRRAHPRARDGDAAIIHRLRALPGAPLRFAPGPLRAAAPLLAAQRDWAMDKMGWDMAEESVDAPDAIGSEADMERIAPETRDWLARSASVPASILTGPEEIAEAVEHLRTPKGLARFNPLRR